MRVVAIVLVGLPVASWIFATLVSAAEHLGQISWRDRTIVLFTLSGWRDVAFAQMAIVGGAIAGWYGAFLGGCLSLALGVYLLIESGRFVTRYRRFSVRRGVSPLKIVTRWLLESWSL